MRRALAALDYQQTIGFSFVEERWEHELAGNPDPIKVLNPIAAPLAVKRPSPVASPPPGPPTNPPPTAGRRPVFRIRPGFHAGHARAPGPPPARAR